MITIHNMEVRFDVEGNDDKARFASMFNELIQKWAAEAEEQKLRDRIAVRDRSLGDRPDDGAFA